MGGKSSTANGARSFAHGNNVETTKADEVAFGKYNVSSDDTLFSVGNGTTDEKHNVFEIKSDNTAYVNNKKVLTEGESVSAVIYGSKPNSLQLKSNLTDKKDGYEDAVASGAGSFAIGGYNGNNVGYAGGKAKANGSFAGGGDTIADGVCSFAYGLGVETLKVSNKYGEAAFGAYNESNNNTLFTIGNGKSKDERSNAFEVNKNGSAIFSGSVTASAFYESSDERLKTFGYDIDVDLDKLAELRKSFFTFNSKPEKMELGVSAQEIQKLYPEIVNENEDGFLSVDYSKLSVIALKAIDKLNDKNKELEERLARIEKALNLQ